MNASIPELTDGERAFIREHLHDDVPKLLLQKHNPADLDLGKLAGQITARQKARHKLPSWYANDRLLFPPPLSVEQGSSEATARFKASLVSGRKLIDITGGMGVDCFYMSAHFEQTTYFDQLETVAQAAAYNFAQLGVSNRIEVRGEEAIATLDRQPETADWIYADPARRDERQRKVAQLADCTPDLTQVLPVLFRASPNILIKTAPLLDIDLAIAQLQSVREVHVIGLEGECKEVLYTLERGYPRGQEVPIRVRLLNAEGTPLALFDFTRGQEAAVTAQFGEPETYLYEPHAALLKAGAFKTIATQYGLTKLAPHTHLYTSTRWIPDFPGRGFEVVAVCKPNARELAAFVPQGKANLTLRNFPGKIDDLRKKWRLKEGGDVYLFAAELSDTRKVVIVTRKVYL
ncbi:THUMP-like domain-containing protein [Salmonirosea aquatica]|uniref:Uncharacterized protein n=1 Tax=Salmonirosea aquatica TaxID=2654236 RepID=A0A7C9FF25_9BACT|nr:hypothetical protein [Cytophagaceae bacterium SJW1-29]